MAGAGLLTVFANIYTQLLESMVSTHARNKLRTFCIVVLVVLPVPPIAYLVWSFAIIHLKQPELHHASVHALHVNFEPLNATPAVYMQAMATVDLSFINKMKLVTSPKLGSFRVGIVVNRREVSVACSGLFAVRSSLQSTTLNCIPQVTPMSKDDFPWLQAMLSVPGIWVRVRGHLTVDVTVSKWLAYPTATADFYFGCNVLLTGKTLNDMEFQRCDITGGEF